jgi:hypothetical protein
MKHWDFHSRTWLLKVVLLDFTSLRQAWFGPFPGKLRADIGVDRQYVLNYNPSSPNLHRSHWSPQLSTLGSICKGRTTHTALQEAEEQSSEVCILFLERWGGGGVFRPPWRRGSLVYYGDTPRVAGPLGCAPWTRTLFWKSTNKWRIAN